MDIKVNKKTESDIDKTPVLHQTSFWSEVKKKQGMGSKAFDIKINADDLGYRINDHIVQDDFLILFQNIGDDMKIGYVPYGPTIDPGEENQGLFLEELSETLRPYLPSGCTMLRYDLLWESPWAKDDSFYQNGEWLGPPARQNQEIRLNINTRKWNLKKANSNVLPTDTVFIDLKKSEQDLLQAMKPKTRYNVRLSMRKGVTVRKADAHELDIWYTLYRETCMRNHILLHDIAYFKTVLETKADRAGSPAEVELLIAEFDSQPLAAMFLVYSGQRATYLYGASSTLKRNYMATYALQWEAIRRARKKGCTEYDMFGTAPYRDPSHPLYGLYRFKTGFGGYMFHRMGCWDYPYCEQDYEQFISLEMKSKGYHLN